MHTAVTASIAVEEWVEAAAATAEPILPGDTEDYSVTNLRVEVDKNVKELYSLAKAGKFIWVSDDP